MDVRSGLIKALDARQRQCSLNGKDTLKAD
jgi:hypothetical protein